MPVCFRWNEGALCSKPSWSFLTCFGPAGALTGKWSVAESKSVHVIWTMYLSLLDSWELFMSFILLNITIFTTSQIVLFQCMLYSYPLGSWKGAYTPPFCSGVNYVWVSFSLSSISHISWGLILLSHGAGWIILVDGSATGSKFLCASTVTCPIGSTPGCTHTIESWSVIQGPTTIPHPDQQFCSYVVQGITSGFRIGFNRSFSLQSASKNLYSFNPAIIFKYLECEVLLQRSLWVPIS